MPVHRPDGILDVIKGIEAYEENICIHGNTADTMCVHKASAAGFR